MSLWLPALALVCGLLLLIWSADRFVEGAAATAYHAGMPSLLIGMVVIGFGTSAPEMVVSAISALQGNPGLALGNAYGSNISNIALILGLTALLAPINVTSSILRKELPLLLLVTVLAVSLLFDLYLSRFDALLLLLGFAGLMGYWIWLGLRGSTEQNGYQTDVDLELQAKRMPLKPALIWLFSGMLLLVVSSRLLVWGAIEIARAFGVSDLIIGLTIVAIGTSLPELASAVAATRKGEHDLALGNVLGSNLFNTLAVVGIAGAIQPLAVDAEILYRDSVVMGLLTLSLFFIAFGRLKQITRLEGLLLVLVYIGYSGYLLSKVVGLL